MEFEVDYIELEEVGSTNTWLAENSAGLRSLTMVEAISQPLGRGQRGNSWESEPGKNLTVSMLYHPSPEMRAAEQFAISEAVALGVVDALADYGIEAKIKWPNDIYVGDRKICGILIEHSLLGTQIQHSICGVGLNVNQMKFWSDAPNPVSMAQLSDRTFDRKEVRERLARNLAKRLQATDTLEGRTGLHQEFLTRLWRGDGHLYPFRDTATGEIFEARIADVEPQGFLLLEPGYRRYAFKEVSFLI